MKPIIEYVDLSLPEGERHIKREMTDAEFSAYQEKCAAEDARISQGAVQQKKNSAQALLDASDRVAIRCVKAGVPFPVEWAEYVAELRAVYNSGAGPLPAQPEYPEGT